MSSSHELFQIAEALENAASPAGLREGEEKLGALEAAAAEVGRAFSGSWLGYHANVYYDGLLPPPPGAHFSQEWGLQDVSFSSLGSRGKWVECDPVELKAHLRKMAGNPNIDDIFALSATASKAFLSYKGDILSILSTEISNTDDNFLVKLSNDLETTDTLSATQVAQIWMPKGQIMTRDMVAAGQGSQIPPHQFILSEAQSIRHSFVICQRASEIARKAASHLQRKEKANARERRLGTNVFIGHGHSLCWRELKDFVQDRLGLPWDEFNRIPVAGVTNQARLSEMIDAAAIAFIIMTAEDERADGDTQARMNVIHEAGLFQGRLGFTKAIILLEEGCVEFSNIQGLGQIRFPKANIGAAFEEIRRVIEREGLI